MSAVGSTEMIKGAAALVTHAGGKCLWDEPRWRNPIGFSTGALAHGDFHRAMDLLDGTSADAVELSALRAHELPPLLEALPELELGGYRHVSIHAPKKATMSMRSGELARELRKTGLPVIVHADTVIDTMAWRGLGERLAMENTTESATEFFRRMTFFPFAKICIDIGHAIKESPRGTLFHNLFDSWSRELAEVHLSVCDELGRHHPLHERGVTGELLRCLERIPDGVPIILEGECSWDRGRVEEEISLVRTLLAERKKI